MAYRHDIDIASELVELCKDIITSVRQELGYYKVSVYKVETATAINDKLSQLKEVINMFNNQGLIEPFQDHEATKQHADPEPVTGECSFSKHTLTLLQGLEAQLSNYTAHMPCQFPYQPRPGFAEHIVKSRRKILSLCRHGTRQWQFFQSL